MSAPLPDLNSQAEVTAYLASASEDLGLRVTIIRQTATRMLKAHADILSDAQNEQLVEVVKILTAAEAVLDTVDTEACDTPAHAAKMFGSLADVSAEFDRAIELLTKVGEGFNVSMPLVTPDAVVITIGLN